MAARGMQRSTSVPDEVRIQYEESNRVAKLIAVLTQSEDARTGRENDRIIAAGFPILQEDTAEDQRSLQVLCLCLCTTTLQVIRERTNDPNDRSRSPGRRIPRTPTPGAASEPALSPQGNDMSYALPVAQHQAG